MKNKKGFTLIELLATIAILGIIITIAVISFVNIRSKVNERQYESLASTIKSAGKGYAEETGINKIFVQTLIDEGLVILDDESKILRDPRDNSPLNCQIVTYDNGNVTLSDDKNPSCDITILNDIAIKIQYINDSGVKEDIPNNYWFNKTITLSVTATGALPVDLSRASFTWSSPLAPDKISTTRDYTVYGDYVDDTIFVTVTLDDRKYQAFTNIKIDKTPPRAFNLIEKNPGNWTPNKEFQFELSDGESGISGWQITYDSYTVPTSWNNLADAGIKNKIINTTKNISGLRVGEYIYVWVKDLVGNTNKSELTRDGSSSLQIKSLDGEVDSVTLSSSPGPGSYSKDITLSGTAQDSKSGITGYVCSKSPSAPASGWISVTKTNAQVPITCPAGLVDGNGRYYLHVRDDVGNVASTNVYIDNYDNFVNSVNLTDAESYLKYREDSTSLTGTATDEGSGIVAYALTTSQATPYSWTNIPTTRYLRVPLTIENNGKYYLHVKDGAGNTAVSNLVKIEGIVVKRNKSFSLKGDSIRQSGSVYVYDDPVQIVDVVVNNYNNRYNGYATASIGYGNTININAYGGQVRQEQVDSYCTGTDMIKTSLAKPYCSYGGNVCYNGGILRSSNREGYYCGADTPDGKKEYHSDFYDQRHYRSYTCKNGAWQCTSSDCSDFSTPPPKGYKHITDPVKGDFYNCNSPSGSCTDGQTWSGISYCYAMSKWIDNYTPQCPSGDIKKYSCSQGKNRNSSSQTCYSCSNGNSYNFTKGACPCKINHNYYKYDGIIYYYVLKGNSYYGY